MSLLAAALLATGCGGGGDEALSKDEYQAKVITAGQQLTTTLQQIAKDANGMSGTDLSSLDDAAKLFDELGEVVRDGESELRAFAGELDALRPPDDAVAANDKLVSGFNGLADAFGDIAAALEDGSLANVLQLARKLQEIGTSEAGRLIQDAIDALEADGYTFEGLG